MTVDRRRSAELDRDYDDSGFNVADPHDHRGDKNAYITTLQTLALREVLAAGDGAPLLEIGCGAGRVSQSLVDLGYAVTGIDPSERLLAQARERVPAATFTPGGLPDLPFPDQSQEVITLISVLRVLHLAGIDTGYADITRVLKPGGRLLVLDNMKIGDNRYIAEDALRAAIEACGLQLVQRRVIRRARWWGIYAVRYGLLPRTWHGWLARHELRALASDPPMSRWRYHNVIHLYEKPAS